MYPESRPITSIKNKRLCEAAVSLIRSTTSITVLHAVSKPSVISVPNKSLSIVPGIPMYGTEYSLLKTDAPLKDPLPPIIISHSKPSFLISSNACFLPLLVRNISLLADLKIVPPRCKILLTSQLER